LVKFCWGFVQVFDWRKILWSMFHIKIMFNGLGFTAKDKAGSFHF